MTTQRTELHDDLRALIAAGRELSPEDDAVLADMFLDRLGRTMEKPRTRHLLSTRNVRRGAGGVVLALALLTGGALVSVEGISHHGESIVVQPVENELRPPGEGCPNLALGQTAPCSCGPRTEGRPASAKGLTLPVCRELVDLSEFVARRMRPAPT